MGRLDYQAVVQIATNEEMGTRQLSPFSLALLLSVVRNTYATFNTDDMTAEELDAAAAAIALCQHELMTEYIPDGQGDEMTPLGAAVPFFGLVVPDLFLLCEGQLLDPAEYPDLYEVIHPAYKVMVEGIELIAMPDLRSRSVIAYESPSWPIGYAGGEAMHTLTAMEMPTHTHGIELGGTAAGDLRIAQATPARSMVGGQSTNSAGSGNAHNNMPPFHICAGYIMRVKNEAE